VVRFHFLYYSSSTDFTNTIRRSIIQIPIMACCVLLIDVFSSIKSKDLENKMAYLSKASGWFGRLAIMSKSDFPFDELIKLISLHRSVYNMYHLSCPPTQKWQDFFSFNGQSSKDDGGRSRLERI
jgi:hypothetical protein